MNKNVINRAKDIQDIVDRHYQPGRNDRCKMQVYRRYIEPFYHISKPTFFRYLRIDTGRLQQPSGEMHKQLNLFES